MEKITSKVCSKTKTKIVRLSEDLNITQSELVRLILDEAFLDDNFMNNIIENVDNEAVDVHFNLEEIESEKHIS